MGLTSHRQTNRGRVILRTLELVGIVSTVGRIALYRSINMSVCLGCGRSFDRGSGNRKFHNPKCYQKMWRKKNGKAYDRRQREMNKKLIIEEKKSISGLALTRYDICNIEIDRCIREAK